MCFMVQSSELYIKDVVCANHTTPREAAKTRDGRERLEALFVDFHQKNISGLLQVPVDLSFLRQELSMI